MEGLDCQEIRAVTPTTAHLLPELLEFPPDAEMNNERDVWAVVATAIELGRNQDGTLGAHLERFKRGSARSRIQAAIVWKASNSVLLQQERSNTPRLRLLLDEEEGSVRIQNKRQHGARHVFEDFDGLAAQAAEVVELNGHVLAVERGAQHFSVLWEVEMLHESSDIISACSASDAEERWWPRSGEGVAATPAGNKSEGLWESLHGLSELSPNRRQVRIDLVDNN